MRAHGLSNFPDPSAGPGGEGFNGIDRVAGGLAVDGITFTGPAAQAAMRACSRFLTPSGPPPQPTAAQKRAALRFAQCLREHGVPNFPDPDFARAPDKPKSGPPANVNPQSPAFQAAAKACGGGQRRLR